MKKLLVLGAGTAGTIIANKLSRELSARDWEIVLIDRDDEHHYQPGYLFIPFGTYDRDDLLRTRHSTLRAGVELLLAEIDQVLPDENVVRLANGREMEYDYLVIATGTTPRPDQTPGMLGTSWRRTIFDFYTLEGAEALAKALDRFDHGRLVVHICETPIKCPVAPLEFVFLADAWLRKKHLRDSVELVFVTPLDGAFTQPLAAAQLGGMLEERKITVEPDFQIEEVDNDRSTLISFDRREVPFDLLVTVPINMGADFVGRSGLGDELNYVPVDKHTLQSTAYDNIFAVGDATNIPTSKAGSVAHFAAEIFADNFLEHIAGTPMTGSFDGHANCFVESGDDKALLIDFNYETQPLPGRYPLPYVGPMSLLKETHANHLGKVAFRHLYWQVLLPGRPLPLPAHMSMAGKHDPSERHRP